MELPVEILIRKSITIAGQSSENKDIVADLVAKLDALFTTENKPQWAVVSALAMMLECTRLTSENAVVEMARKLEESRVNGTN